MNKNLNGLRSILTFSVISILGHSAHADMIEIFQAGTSFSPKDVTINVGDTVRWVWTSGSHTVTEGTDGTTNGNEAFDSHLDPDSPTVEVVFDAAFLAQFPRPGDLYDFFCVPHFTHRMTGLIRVETGPGLIYCTCDGHDGTPPCNNWSQVGRGCRNSTAGSAQLLSDGSASVAADDLTFSTSGLIPGQAALLFAGVQEINGGNGVAFGDGLRCAGTNVVRLGTQIPGATGLAFWGPGLAAQGGWSAGEQRRFQVWYRDTPAGNSPCGSGFNFSNGLALTFAP